jgi:hypothetical protein
MSETLKNAIFELKNDAPDDWTLERLAIIEKEIGLFLKEKS